MCGFILAGILAGLLLVGYALSVIERREVEKIKKEQHKRFEDLEERREKAEEKFRGFLDDIKNDLDLKQTCAERRVRPSIEGVYLEDGQFLYKKDDSVVPEDLITINFAKNYRMWKK